MQRATNAADHHETDNGDCQHTDHNNDDRNHFRIACQTIRLRSLGGCQLFISGNVIVQQLG